MKWIPVSKIAISNQDMRYAEDNSGMSSDVMMQRAGTAVAAVIIRRFPKGRVLVVCGPGNNGGDGLVVARVLQSCGWSVETLTEPGNISDCDILVDAIFGSGLSRNVVGAWSDVVAAINDSRAAVVSVDVPSGISGDNGSIMGTAVRADLTVAFQAPKIGHLLFPGREFSGELIVEDIGIESRLFPSKTFVNSPELWHKYWPRLRYDSNKYSRGHLMVLGGEMLGAASLATRSGQRAHVGMVTQVFGDAVERQLPDSIIRRSCGGLAAFVSKHKVTAAIIGPGFGASISERVLELLEVDLPCVVDADALVGSILSKNLLRVVLTPHHSEFCRLFPNINTLDRLSAAREAARISGAVIVYKGADTVIASQEGSGITAININSSFNLATAGSGDVLAGIIGGFLGAGMPTFMAAAAGVWLHGECSRRLPTVSTAEDLISVLDDVVSYTRDLCCRLSFVKTY